MSNKSMTVADLRKRLTLLQKELKTLPQSRKIGFVADSGGYTDMPCALVHIEFDGQTLITHYKS
jgi:hypothetical protein